MRDSLRGTMRGELIKINIRVHSVLTHGMNMGVRRNTRGNGTMVSWHFRYFVRQRRLLFPFALNLERESMSNNEGPTILHAVLID